MNNFCVLLDRLRDVLIRSTLMKTYFSQNQPKLHYGVVVYGTAKKRSLQNLELNKTKI